MRRGKLPIIVGGSGLYIDALLYDFKFRQTTTDRSREELDASSVEELQKLVRKEEIEMPKNDKNPRHLIRTIESGGQISKKGKKLQGALVVGIDPGKDDVEQRIKRRVQIMLEQGFVEEVDGIVKVYGEPPQDVDAIGYRIALQCRNSDGSYDVEKLEELFVIADRQYAKRQRSWFKNNKDIVWFDNADDAYEYIKSTI
jgi:tRNA dimethylallyltransferase